MPPRANGFSVLSAAKWIWGVCASSPGPNLLEFSDLTPFLPGQVSSMLHADLLVFTVDD